VLEGREIELTGLAVALQLKPSHLLEMCRKYWRSHCQLNSCFQDLRRYIESMSREEQQEFHQFISESAISSKPDPKNSSFVGFGPPKSLHCSSLTQSAERTQKLAPDRTQRHQVRLPVSSSTARLAQARFSQLIDRSTGSLRWERNSIIYHWF
jgi:hypothetical protein